jgi:hypothetical protein
VQIAATPDGPVNGFACASATQCTETFKAGMELTFDPQAAAATPAVRLDHSDVFYGVSCPSLTQCTVVTQAGGEVTFDPQTGATQGPVTIDAGYVLASVSCPSVDQCTAGDDGGRVVTFDPNAPASPLIVTVTGTFNPGAPSTLACPSASQCTVIVEQPLNSTAFTIDPTVQAKATNAFTTASAAIDCPSTTLCVLTGGSPYVTAYDPHSATATSGWTASRCRGDYRTWAEQHRRASAAQKRAEAKGLEKQHGCPASSV